MEWTTIIDLNYWIQNARVIVVFSVNKQTVNLCASECCVTLDFGLAWLNFSCLGCCEVNGRWNTLVAWPQSLSYFHEWWWEQLCVIQHGIELPFRGRAKITISRTSYVGHWTRRADLIHSLKQFLFQSFELLSHRLISVH